MILQNSNTALELSIIGTLLTDYKNTIKYFNNVKPEHFNNKASSIILIKANECYINNFDFTIFTAMEYLKANGFSEEYANDYLANCTNLVCSNYELIANLKILKELYNKRKIHEILNKSISSTKDFDEVLDQTMQNLYDLRKSSINKKKMKPIKEVALEYLDRFNYKDIENRCDTGFSLLDSILQGMSKGQLIGIAARPGVGKTAFAVNIGLNVIRNNKAVAIFSQEMEAIEVYERILSRESGISMSNLINMFDDLIESEKEINYQKYINKSNSLSKLPLYISDITRLTTADIKTECLNIQRLGLVIIDYLQLMQPMRREDRRDLEIGQITRELKNLSSELGCPILLISQLNRVRDETQKPNLKDLRESGSIEQDLVKSMMLWNLDKEKKRIGLTVNKNRRGKYGDIEFSFDGEHMTFKEVEFYKERKKQTQKIDWENLQ